MKREILEKYRSKVNFHYLTNEELLNAFDEKYALREVDIDAYPILTKSYIESVLEHREDTTARVFVLEKNAQSHHYYDVFRAEDFEPFPEIYILLGNKDYYESNCSEVFCDLFFLKGITEEEYEKGEVKARQYVDMLENP